MDQGGDVAGVEARGRDEGLPDGEAPEGLGLVAVTQGHGLEDHLARQRVAVRVQAARREAHDDVSRDDARSVDDPLATDDPDRESREVVLAARVHARQLRGLAAEQRASTLGARCSDAGDDLLGHSDVELPRAEVVEEEEGARPAGDDVVDAHADEVEPHGVVDPCGEGDLELGPHPVGAAHEDGLLDVGRYAAEPREAPDIPHHLGDAGGGGEGLDALDQVVARVDVDAGLLVRQRGNARHGAQT